MKGMHFNAIKVFILILVTFNLSAVAQELPPSSVKSIIAATDILHNKYPAEKVYLHTDKPSYNIGDTIWFKAYVFDAAYLTGSRMSRLLFVELHNDSSELVRRISIHVEGGLGHAQIPLIKEIFHEGGYTIRAYTNWMKNFGADRVFSKRFFLSQPNVNAWLANSSAKVDQTDDKELLQVDINLKDAEQVPVGLRKVNVKIMEADKTLYNNNTETTLEGKLEISYKLKGKRDGRNMRLEIQGLRKDEDNPLLRIPLDIDRPEKIDLQFLPEGGNLVAGLKSTVGFKAIGENGKGTDVAGAIYDSKNNMVCPFTSLHKGMGAFGFVPKPRETYTAKLSRPEGTASSFNLPASNPSGTVLHIENPDQQDSLQLSINATMDVIGSTGTFCLIVSSRGIVWYAQTVDFKKTKTAIAKSLFPTGIARFTLLKGDRPLNERIVFIDHQDNFEINITTDKPSYVKRDSVGLEIAVKDKSGSPVMGSFSLAVTDDAQVKPDNMGNFGIATSLLLNADLKGTIEDPGFYLNRNDKLAWTALDHLMLTQGWTGFDWKDVFTPIKEPEFDAGISYKTIGKVKPMTFPATHLGHLMPWYVNGDRTQLNYAKNKAATANYERALTGIVLKEVKVTSKKINYNTFNLNGFGQADIVLDTADVRKSATTGLYQLLKQKIPGLRIEFDHVDERNQGYALKIGDRWVRIRFDNSMEWVFLTKTPQALKDKLNLYPVYNIRSVEIMYTQKYLWKYFPPTPAKPFTPGERAKTFEAYALSGRTPPTGEQKLYAVVQLTTSTQKKPDPNPLSIMSPLKFYSPKYKTDSSFVNHDVRSTVYWIPNIVTDKNGKAKVTFYTADVPGSYTLSLEGSDLQGSIGSFKAKVDIL